MNNDFCIEEEYEECLQEIKRLKKSEKEALDTLESATYENINLINEVDRLNNIINELEKWLEDYHNNTGLGEYETGIDDGICDTLKKLQELKGDSSNG